MRFIHVVLEEYISLDHPNTSDDNNIHDEDIVYKRQDYMY